MNKNKSIVALISGNGTNLCAIVESPHCKGIDIRCVISNRDDAAGDDYHGY